MVGVAGPEAESRGSASLQSTDQDRTLGQKDENIIIGHRRCPVSEMFTHEVRATLRVLLSLGEKRYPLFRSCSSLAAAARESAAAYQSEMVTSDPDCSLSCPTARRVALAYRTLRISARHRSVAGARHEGAHGRSGWSCAIPFFSVMTETASPYGIIEQRFSGR